MAQIRVAILWHMHQPFYKDLVTGEYRLPWVRLHALKDYYGMVKLLDEFPQAHQTFNLVPSLISQIQDYVSGMARDPFLEVAAKPAADLTPEERRFALAYLFQANPGRMIGRYPRYQALFDLYGASGYNPVRAEATFERKDFADLQVLSQLAWFDEFFLAEPDIAELVRKGRNYTPDDQRFLLRRQHDMLSKVLPAYADAAKRGLIEISTSPFYHPILPLVCDSNQGGVSSPGLPLPARNFRHPEDARAQIQRGLDLHQEVFGVTPKGMWPSEGSVSEEVIALAYDLGVKWMATDEGVLGRTIGMHFERGGDGRLPGEKAAKLYTPHRYEKSNVNMDMIFRDHTLSDLIGFVYSGMPAHDAAGHFIRSIKDSARPVIESGHDALVPIILDGENAWEFYPESGREFLRRVYDALQNDSELEAVTVSEGLEHIPDPPRLRSIVPGSWINANFNIWIGAPEDNRAWDYLSDARDFYEQNSGKASPGPRELAFEELLIAEGSDWNWWYGPEHHSANDRDFDELYRKHLSNVYQALGSHGPEYLAQPIAQGVGKPTYSPQSGYIHPKIGAPVPRYFDWIGAAMYTADRHSGAMHGKVYLLDAMHVGVDEKNLYGRLDFIDSEIPQEQFQIVSGFEVLRPAPGGNQSENVSRRKLVADVKLKLQTWELRDALTDTAIATSYSPSDIKVTLARSFEFQIPLQIIGAELGSTIRLRFSVLRDTLPLDSLPLEGSIALHVVSEEEMEGAVYNYSTSS